MVALRMAAQIFGGDLLALQVLLHQIFVVLGDGLDQLRAILSACSTISSGMGSYAHILAQVVVVDISLHLDQVDDARKVSSCRWAAGWERRCSAGDHASCPQRDRSPRP